MLNGYCRTGPELLQVAQNYAKSQGDLYGPMRIRCVADLDKEVGWKNVLTIIQAFPAGAAPKPEKSTGFETFRFMETWTTIDQLHETMAQVENKFLGIDGLTVMFNGAFRQWSLLPGGNAYAPQAGYFFDGGSSGYQALRTEPLLAFDQPFFLDGGDAARQWLGFAVDRDRIGRALVFLPECRAGFDKLLIEEGKLRIHTRLAIPELASDLKLKGAWHVAGQRKAIEAEFGAEVQLDVPSGAQEVQIYLVGRDNTLYDYHDETRFWNQGRQRLLGGVKGGPLLQAAAEALKSCECNTVEFKPYIEPGNQKAAEIVESAIAFANTQGGIVLFGVTKNCQVDGIEQDIARKAVKAGQSTEAAMREYQGWLRRLVSDKVDSPVALEIEPVALRGHTILCMKVPEAAKKPVMNIETREIFVRYGANNVRPDKDDLGRLFVAKRQQPYLFGNLGV
jgi:hypothetical protein